MKAAREVFSRGVSGPWERERTPRATGNLLPITPPLAGSHRPSHRSASHHLSGKYLLPSFFSALVTIKAVALNFVMKASDAGGRPSQSGGLTK